MRFQINFSSPKKSHDLDIVDLIVPQIRSSLLFLLFSLLSNIRIQNTRYNRQPKKIQRRFNPEISLSFPPFIPIFAVTPNLFTPLWFQHFSHRRSCHDTFSSPPLRYAQHLFDTTIFTKKERKKGEKLGNDVSDKFRRVVQWRYRSSRRERKKETTKSSATSSLLFPPSFNREKRTIVSPIDTFARELLPRVIIR